ncbi:hypothetical protein VARIO8X_120019 [Burkholderiales bacterium 8X]|nr:hypothetical protein VARIO8X_120019 [Burkholderiales bacterium 8X]
MSFLRGLAERALGTADRVRSQHAERLRSGSIGWPSPQRDAQVADHTGDADGSDAGVLGMAARVAIGPDPKLPGRRRQQAQHSPSRTDDNDLSAARPPVSNSPIKRSADGASNVHPGDEPQEAGSDTRFRQDDRAVPPRRGIRRSGSGDVDPASALPMPPLLVPRFQPAAGPVDGSHGPVLPIHRQLQRHGAEARTPTEVHVSIGRIDLAALPGEASKTRPAARPGREERSLADYLRGSRDR